MKRIFLTTLLTATGLLNAQKLGVELKIGYVNSTLNFTEFGYTEKFDTKHSIYISVPIEYHINPHFSLQGELRMTGLGGKNLIINNQKSRLHLTTVYIPLGFKVYPIKNTLSAVEGFNFGIITKALGGQSGQAVKFNSLNSFNYSFYPGTEYRITKLFSAEIRYNKGIGNIVKEQDQITKNNFFPNWNKLLS